MICYPSKLDLPPVQNLSFGKGFPIRMTGRRLKDQERVRKIVLLAERSDVGKPGFIGVNSVIIKKSMAPMLVEDVVGAKSSNHTKMTKHLKVKKSSGRQASCQEHHNTFRGSLMESLEALNVDLVVVVDGRHLKVRVD